MCYIAAIQIPEKKPRFTIKIVEILITKCLECVIINI